MLRLIVRRIFVMILTMLAMSFLVFIPLEINPDGVARKALGTFTTRAQRIAWLTTNNYYTQANHDNKKQYQDQGYLLYAVTDKTFVVIHPPEKGGTYPQKEIDQMDNDEAELLNPLHVPLITRYFIWLKNFSQGELGYSFRFKKPVSEVLWPRLVNTAILAGTVMLIMIPLSLFLGIMAGIREGSLQDRIFSLIAIITNSVPEFASAVLFVWIFTFLLGILPGTSSMVDGFAWRELILPVMVLVVYDSGYIARITRASMIDVMHSPFIRTAILKGLPYKTVIFRHALRNALITPVTVIMLQFPWLLSGVIVVEYFFAYKGFGSLLWAAASNSDPYLIEACAMVSVVVVVITQLLSDLLYTYINPRIRFQ